MTDQQHDPWDQSMADKRFECHPPDAQQAGRHCHMAVEHIHPPAKNRQFEPLLQGHRRTAADDRGHPSVSGQDRRNDPTPTNIGSILVANCRVDVQRPLPTALLMFIQGRRMTPVLATWIDFSQWCGSWRSHEVPQRLRSPDGTVRPLPLVRDDGRVVRGPDSVYGAEARAADVPDVAFTGRLGRAHVDVVGAGGGFQERGRIGVGR